MDIFEEKVDSLEEKVDSLSSHTMTDKPPFSPSLKSLQMRPFSHLFSSPKPHLPSTMGGRSHSLPDIEADPPEFSSPPVCTNFHYGAKWTTSILSSWKLFVWHARLPYLKNHLPDSIWSTETQRCLSLPPILKKM